MLDVSVQAHAAVHMQRAEGNSIHGVDQTQISRYDSQCLYLLTTSSPLGSKLWLCSCHEIYTKHTLYAVINHVSSFNTISIYPCEPRDRTEIYMYL